MLILVEQRSLRAGVAAPQHKDEVRASFVQIFDGGFGKDFPAFAAVGARLVGFDGEDVV